jgi:hypothetical protein
MGISKNIDKKTGQKARFFISLELYDFVNFSPGGPSGEPDPSLRWDKL